jgi:hypothetical protein
LVRTLSGQTGAVEGVAFSRDGTLPATNSRDKTARAYKTLLEQLIRALSGVDAEDSAQEFSSWAADQIRGQAALVPEFYIGEFLNMLKDGVVRQSREEIDAAEKEKKDTHLEADTAMVELNARLKTARAAGDQEAEHVVWREREEIQAALQGRIDAVARRADSASIRLDAFRNLASSLGTDFT